jgi:hypothetical protein
MLDYTAALRALMADVVRRVEGLSAIPLEQVLVFARAGRTGADGAYATCHSLVVPASAPCRDVWRDATTGRVTRQSPLFVLKAPRVFVNGTRIRYLISFALPRFCDQTLEGASKRHLYPGYASWVARLDTVVHELYHVDPRGTGIRRLARADGGAHHRCHSPEFYRQVARFVREYFASGPDPAVYEFLRHDFAELRRRHGGVAGLTFRTYPSYPQRYREVLSKQPPRNRRVRHVPLATSHQPRRYTEADLRLREFGAPTGARTPAARRRPAA